MAVINVVTTLWFKPEEWYLFGKRQANERRCQAESEGETYVQFGRQWRIGVDWGTHHATLPSAEPVETEGDRLARFFATSAHEGHEQVRAEPERDELGAMIDAAPPAAALHLAHDGELVMREERDGNPRAVAVLDDWYKTCLAVDMQRQDERRLAASLAAIPDDFDLLPDAE